MCRPTDVEAVLARLPRRGVPMILREVRDGITKPYSFSGIQKIVHTMRDKISLPSTFTLDLSFQEVVHWARAMNAEVAKHQRFAEDRMDTHKNAPLTPKGRELMVRAVVDGGLTKAAAARQFHTT